jgi:hypothetical protein
MLWLYALALAVTFSTAAEIGELPKSAELVSRIALPFIIASWVVADAHKRGRRLCYDFDAFVYFAWPVVVPIYLFQTRGARAFITLLCFVGIWLVAMLAAMLIIVVREFVAP